MSVPPPGNRPPPHSVGQGDDTGSKPGVPNVTPKLGKHLRPDQTSKKTLLQRVPSKQEAKPPQVDTKKMWAAKEAELLNKADEATMLWGLKHCLDDIKALKKNPEYVPADGAVTQIYLEGKWVNLVPPDQEGLKGHDVKKLLGHVETALGKYNEGQLNKFTLPQLEGFLGRLVAELNKLNQEVVKGGGDDINWPVKWETQASKPVTMEVSLDGKKSQIQRLERSVPDISKLKPEEEEPPENDTPEETPGIEEDE